MLQSLEFGLKCMLPIPNATKSTMASARVLLYGHFKACLHFITWSYTIAVAYLTAESFLTSLNNYLIKETCTLVCLMFCYGQKNKEHRAINYNYKELKRMAGSYGHPSIFQIGRPFDLTGASQTMAKFLSMIKWWTLAGENFEVSTLTLQSPTRSNWQWLPLLPSCKSNPPPPIFSLLSFYLADFCC